MILRLTGRQLTTLRQESLEAYPVEACALLFGKATNKEAKVERVVVTPNTLQSATLFEISTRAFYEAFTQASADGMEFLGFFHSHPSSTNPSEIDQRFMKLWGDAIWLILSLTDKKLGAFQIRNNRIHRVVLKT